MKKTLKRLQALVSAMTLILALVSCVPTGEGITTASDSFKVGISIPTQKLQRWVQNAHYMEEALGKLGYEVDLQFAGDNEVLIQNSQIENMIAAGVDVLIIAALDDLSLTEVLATAKARDIPVIAYDRLICGTDAVNYFITFNNDLTGVRLGEFIRDMLDLDNAEGPFYIEFFTSNWLDYEVGEPNFPGTMSILQPYLDCGMLVCPSGQTDTEQITIEMGSYRNAEARMEYLISYCNYHPSGGTPLHAVMCSTDFIAMGVTSALVDAGFEGGDDFPIITGAYCELESVRNIRAGTQSMSIFIDTHILVKQTIEMVNAIATGTEVPVNDRITFDNGTGIIPTFLCPSVIVTRENYREHLIDSGYYTEAEILYGHDGCFPDI